MGQVISATGPAPAPVASSAAPWDAFGGAMASDGFNGRLSMLDVVYVDIYDLVAPSTLQCSW